MLPYRLIVIDSERTATTFVIPLERVPGEGDEVEIPHGGRCVVTQILSSDSADVVGIIMARAS